MGGRRLFFFASCFALKDANMILLLPEKQKKSYIIKEWSLILLIVTNGKSGFGILLSMVSILVMRCCIRCAGGSWLSINTKTAEMYYINGQWCNYSISKDDYIETTITKGNRRFFKTVKAPVVDVALEVVNSDVDFFC